MAQRKENKTSSFVAFCQRWTNSEGTWGHDPAHFDGDFVQGTLEKTSKLFGPGRYFDVQVDGWKKFQEQDSHALTISNHSGGLLTLDAWGWMTAWYQNQTVERPMHALAHEAVFSIPALAKRLARLGALRADFEMGLQILRDTQHDLLLFPGGDVDTFRPYKDRYKVNFAGRKGYARLALESGAPIRPIAHAGAHETLIVLSSGKRIAEKMGLPKLIRAQIFPIYLCFPWGLSVGPLPQLPPPTKLRYKIGDLIEMPRKTWRERPSEDLIERIDRHVQQQMQKLLAELQEEEEPHLLRDMALRFIEKATQVAQDLFPPTKLLDPPFHASESAY
ncbi:MAG: 1-acyl-sn-glycerol-3-phosphate acyltransferase [Myxococcales bacterium]|nr:1-acyl-sn-glycerol-3-phosphate acyltransferase [Myxococcales bacterium]MCB9644472.1 1-acyl-sn-glycerol-3-phosphate acyltransferase [Myxococcales bacterium]